MNRIEYYKKKIQRYFDVIQKFIESDRKDVEEMIKKTEDMDVNHSFKDILFTINNIDEQSRLYYTGSLVTENEISLQKTFTELMYITELIDIVNLRLSVIESRLKLEDEYGA